MDLRSWLERKAGLSSKALQAAVRACEQNFLETVVDLRIAAEMESEFKETFPQTGIRTRIIKALAADENDDAAMKAAAGEALEAPEVDYDGPIIDVPQGKFVMLCMFR